MAKLFYRIAVALIWIMVFALALEAAARVRYHWDRAAVAEFKSVKYERQKEIGAEIMEATPGPPRPAWAPDELPDLEVFPTLDEAGRKAFCDARQEAMVICDAAGEVVQVYLPSGPSEIVKLASLYTPGMSIADALPEAQGQDALMSTIGAAQGGWGGIHDYMLVDFPAPGDIYTASYLFTPFPPAEDGNARAAVSVFASKYDRFLQSYKPHYFISSDDYPIYSQFTRAEFWTNAQGFRGAEVALPKPEGRFRVVCVGGSTTVEGPRNDLTYPAMLEALLQERFGADRVDVVNCGVDGKDSYVERMRLPDYLALDPDLIIYYTFANDHYRIYNEEYLKLPARTAASGHEWKLRLAHSMFLFNTFRRQFLPQEELIRPLIEASTIARLREARGTLEGRGIQMAVSSVAIPAFDTLDRIEAYCFDPRYGPVNWGMYDIGLMQMLFGVYNRAAEEFCDAEGVLYVPVAEQIEGGMELFNDICHMTIPGMRLKAEIMFEHVAPLVAQGLGEAGGGEA